MAPLEFRGKASLLTLLGVLLALLAAGGMLWQFTESRQPVRIGVLHSLTGTMAASETPLVDAVRLAVEEANRSGGIAVIKRLRDAIGECAFHIEDRGDLKIQFGRAAYPFEGRTATDLMRAASEDITRRRCVLIVDDNTEIFRALQADFEGKNVDFEFCDNAEKAFDAIRWRIPDLIILDIMSPRMNGYELLGRIKHNILTTFIPVIILSDKVRGDIEKEFKELGEIPIVAKAGWHEELVYFIDNIT